MGESTEPPAGPDLALGVSRDQVPEGGMLGGHVGGEAVLLSRLDGRFHAIGATCTHYGGPLGEGVVSGDVVRCPWHHACFDLRTGAAVRAPAFAAVDCWRVEEAGGRVFVREKAEPAAPAPVPVPDDVRSIVIVGGGAAGFACAVELRTLGYHGRLVVLSADADAPYDRPNLSKDYLAGTAPEEWIPLRGDDFYREHGIELRLSSPVSRLDAAARSVTVGGEAIGFDRLLLATGADPVALSIPGFTERNVHLLRSLADARALIRRARPGTRAAIIGSNFIGLEAAAALRKRGVAVEVVSESIVPFAHVFGRAVGQCLQKLHEANGVRFHLSRTPKGFDGRRLTLDDGSAVEADFVVAGVGVRPRTSLATSGIAVADGIVVDPFLATGVPGVFAAGDVAAYPDPMDGRPIRIEHWVTAERQGQVAARNMLGQATRFAAVPFFWTEQYGISLRYVGHCRRWDEIEIDGEIAAHDFIARYRRDGTMRASLACGRDRESLEDELALEARARAG
jgi:NADPH-dependent 2,4-dienoyl-CoA reductase/sulfur reductase-like enzyme/nitrite reductase/ring-hydroxylating ferredoxin subunit